jgi:hypothetical protein
MGVRNPPDPFLFTTPMLKGRLKGGLVPLKLQKVGKAGSRNLGKTQKYMLLH